LLFQANGRLQLLLKAGDSVKMVLAALSAKV
jgi:hypothetical protein